MNEFDEQAPTALKAAKRLLEYQLKLNKGDETHGVVNAMEAAALRAGVTPAECARIQRIAASRCVWCSGPCKGSCTGAYNAGQGGS